MATFQAEQFIAGERVSEGDAGETIPVLNPATSEALGRVRMDAVDAADRAVAAAKSAYPAWAAMPVGDRVQYLFRYKQLLEDRFEELASLIVAEHGKTLAEAKGSVRRGIDCVEYASSAPVLMMGRSLPQIAVSSSFCRTEDEGGIGIDSSADRMPIGVCVGITPFNFPLMVPMWMWPMAVACGNTFVLKPSEKVPISAVRQAELAFEAGLPAGVLNVVPGGPAVAERLITHPDVRAVSFVGSTNVGRHIYETATAAGKRAQSMCGAKNRMVIMPDANRAAAIDGVIGSVFGTSGQRCLAGSVAIPVGEAADWFVPGVVEAARKLVVGPGDEPASVMGPVIDEASKDRILGYIDIGLSEGATLLLDGRGADIPSGGCFVGPSIFDNVTTGMRISHEEIFGPVMSIMRADTLDDAIGLVNASEYGNMAVIFTGSGHAARKFKTTTTAGMIGVNVGVPAPMAVFPFAGWKHSFFGDLHANGDDALRFYTEYKIMVSRWL